jgi:hypothetical protein
MSSMLLLQYGAMQLSVSAVVAIATAWADAAVCESCRSS